MTTSKDALAARMAGGAAKRTTTDKRHRGETAIRTKPVRITLDLDPQTYAALNRWIAAAALEVNPDLPRLSQSQALRAMVHATIEDQAVAAVVLELLRQSGSD